jgi:penicillin-binding protein 1B
MIRKKPLFFILSALLTLSIIYLIVWLIRTDLLIKEKFASGRFVAPTQFYSNSLELSPNQVFSPKIFIDLLRHQQYREKTWGSRLQPSDFAVSQGEDCEKIYSRSFKCFAFYHHLQKKIQIVASDELDRVLVLLEVDPDTKASKNLDSLLLFPELFAQYLGDKPIIQDPVPLNQIPRQCLDAVLAIEDPQFLDHQGVSFRGLLRALWVNLRSGRLAQGGSTITQQLVKNHFLSAERKLSRKIKEMMMAFLVERAIPKDQILETYLNIIYLGQQGNFQIRGYSSAAQFYFNKSLPQLDLADCSLLGAIVNSPGLFNPFKNKDRALQRRHKVLTAMVEQSRILPEDKELAEQKALPQKVAVEIRETAPYFIDGVIKTLRSEGFMDLSGFKIYTTLDLQIQKAAQQAVQNQLEQLETSSAYHIKNKNHSLQAVLLSSDPKTGEVLALVGGRDHRKTPFNRVLESSRQVGSIFKPLVYLTAFQEIENFSPLTPLTNKPFVHTSAGQKWSPKNYDGQTSESVPAFYALKESLNIPTAQLAIDVGLEEVISTAQQLGVTSEIKPYASLSLGAFEMTPWEVLQLYTNISRWGSTIPLRLIKKIENLEGETVWSPFVETPTQVLSPGAFIDVVSILQEAMKTGTGQSATAAGLTLEIAGKTGTTTNYKDAWFAGFSSRHVAVVWTGYDDNTPIQLSGASGALPIWIKYMKSLESLQEAEPFVWPQSPIKTLSLTAEKLMELGVPPNKAVDTQILFAEKE